MQKIYTIEYSPSQNCLHFDELDRVIQINLKKFITKQDNDWTIIGVFETEKEANDFCKRANEYIKGGKQMRLSKLIKLDKIVEEILREDKLAREDDAYLIFKVVQKIAPELAGTTFANVMFNAKARGISFESITRARRKVQQMHPELVDKETELIRETEQLEYMQYANERHYSGY